MEPIFHEGDLVGFSAMRGHKGSIAGGNSRARPLAANTVTSRAWLAWFSRLGRPD